MIAVIIVLFLTQLEEYYKIETESEFSLYTSGEPVPLKFTIIFHMIPCSWLTTILQDDTRFTITSPQMLQKTRILKSGERIVTQLDAPRAKDIKD